MSHLPWNSHVVTTSRSPDNAIQQRHATGLVSNVAPAAQKFCACHTNRLETRHVGASKRAFRARIPPKSMFSYEFSLEPENLQPQNWCFVRGFRQFSAHLTKCHACQGIGTMSPLHAALTMRFAKTSHKTRLKCCACHAKWRWWSPKCCAATKNRTHLLKTSQKHLRLPHKTTFDTLPNTSECHEVPRLPRETRLRDVWNLQAQPYGQRLRTVANGCTTSGEHSLNPQTPRVKREPLPRIREKLSCRFITIFLWIFPVENHPLSTLSDNGWHFNKALMRCRPSARPQPGWWIARPILVVTSMV